MRVVLAGDLCPGQCRQFRDGPPRVELCWWKRVCGANVRVTSAMMDLAKGPGTMTVGGVSGEGPQRDEVRSKGETSFPRRVPSSLRIASAHWGIRR